MGFGDLFGGRRFRRQFRSKSGAKARRISALPPLIELQRFEPRLFAGTILAAATEGVVNTLSLASVVEESWLLPSRGNTVLDENVEDTADRPWSWSWGTGWNGGADRSILGGAFIESYAPLPAPPVGAAELETSPPEANDNGADDWSVAMPPATFADFAPSDLSFEPNYSAESEPIELSDEPQISIGENFLESYTPYLGGEAGQALLTPQSDPPGAPLLLPKQDVTVSADNLADWTLVENGGTTAGKGGVAATGGGFTLVEGDSFLLSLSKQLAIPTNPGQLHFRYDRLSFDTNAEGEIRDAFEVALVDANNAPLVEAHAAGRDSYFNLTEGLTDAQPQGAGVNLSGDRVSLDISSVAPGTAAKLVFRLVNNDDDHETTVRLLGSSNSAPDVDVKNIVGGEGKEVELMADFIDPDDAGAHTATINWGDGTATAAGVIVEAAGAGTVSGKHTYADDGQYTVTVSVKDAANVTGSDTATAAIANAAPIADAGPSHAVNEGATVSLDGSFTDLGTADTHTYRWEITDPSGGVVSEATTLDTTFTAEDDGAYLATLTVTDDEGLRATAVATISAASIAPTAVLSNDAPVDAGQPVTFTFADQFDPSPVDTAAGFTYLFDFNGDGDFDDAVDVTSMQPQQSYVFPDSGTHTVRARIVDKDGAFNEFEAQANVLNVSPTVVLDNHAGTEGASVDFAASFTDPSDPHAHVAVISWGDGTPDTTVNVAAGQRNISASHTYADDGHYVLDVTVTDSRGLAGSATATASITNVAPSANAGADRTVNEGSAQTLEGSFTDPGSADAHTYLWQVEASNGQVVAEGTSPSFSFTPNDEGVYTVSFTVTDDDAGSDTDVMIVTVDNVAPSVEIVGAPNGAEGASLGLSGTFSDPGTVDTHVATVDWGDGTNGSVTIVDGNLSASHVYADNGTYTVRLRVTDSDGAWDEQTATATITNATPAVTGGNVTASEGQKVTYSASFTDAGSADSHTAVVKWGDGTQTAVPPVNGTAPTSFQLDHYYADDGVYPISIEVTDDDGALGVAAATTTIDGVAPTLTGGFGFRSIVENGQTVLAIVIAGSFTDPGFTRAAAGTAETFSATIDWGDGVTESVTPTVTQGTDGQLTRGFFSKHHVYAAGQVYAPVVTLTDDDGDFATLQDTVSTPFKYGVYTIDINPNSINLKSNGTNHVQVQGVTASWIDGASLRFGPAGARAVDAEVSNSGSSRYNSLETGIQPTDQVAFLTGKLKPEQGGAFFVGMNAIGIAEGSDNGRSGVLPSNTKFFVADAQYAPDADGDPFHAVFGYGTGGSTTGNFVFPSTRDASGAVVSLPAGIAANSDGSTVWTVDANTSQVLVQNPAGSFLGSWFAQGVQHPVGITTNQVGSSGDADVWLVDATQKTVHRYIGAATQRSGVAIPAQQFALHVDNASPTDLVTDGNTIWISDDAADKVFVYDVSGNSLGSWSLHASNADVSGLTINPGEGGSGSIWTVDRADKRVYEYSAARALTSGSGTLAADFALANGNVSPEGIADPPISSNPPLVTPDHRGTDFWFSLPWMDGIPWMHVTAPRETTAWLQLPGQTREEAIQLTIIPGQTTQMELPQTVKMSASFTGTFPGAIENCGAHLWSTDEIEVQIMGFWVYNSDSYTALPTDALGTTYIVAGYRHAGLGVVATEDATVVTITPTQDLVDNGTVVHPAGQPFDILLQQGQTFAAMEDFLTGSTITSNKPIAVYAHSFLYHVPMPPDQTGGDSLSGNIGYEQLAPTSQWGTEFHTFPFAPFFNPMGYTLGFLAAHDNTQISVNGQAHLLETRGSFWDSYYTGPIHITSDKPIAVLQYLGDEDGTGPTMTLVPPTAQYLDNYTFAASEALYTPEAGTGPSYSFGDGFLNVTAPSGSLDEVRLDGVTVAEIRASDPSIQIIPIDATISGVSLPFEPGDHTLSGSEPFGAIAYAYLLYDAYSFPVGFGMASRPSAPTITVNSPEDEAVLRSGYAVVTGVVRPSQPTARISTVTVNEVPVDAVDAAGNFFARVEVADGENQYIFAVTDIRGQRSSVTLTLHGAGELPGTVRNTGNAAASATAEYGRTSFNGQTDTLFTEVRIRNDDPYEYEAPLRVGVENVSDDDITVQGHDLTLGGIPVFDFSADMPPGGLAPGIATASRTLRFENPQRQAFTYELTLVDAEFINSPPNFTSIPPVRGVAGRAYVYSASASDPEGLDVDYALLEAPQGMVIDEETGSLSWAIPSGQAAVGTYAVRIVARDPDGATAEHAYSLSVVSSSDQYAPRFTSVPVLIAEAGHPYRYEFSASDLDGDALTFSAVTGATVQFDEAARALHWTPTADELAAGMPVTLTVTDSTGRTDTQTFTIRDVAQNTPPQIVSTPPIHAVEREQYIYPVRALDTADDILEYRLTQAPQGMTIDLFGIIRWTPGDATPGIVTVEVRDIDGATDTQSFTITVADRPANQPPRIISTPSRVTTVGDAFQYQIVAEDPEEGWLRYEFDRDASGNPIRPAGMVIDWTGLVSWLPTAPVAGQRVRIKVTDSGNPNQAGYQEFFLDAVANEAPVIVSRPPTTAIVGSTYQHTLIIDDNAGDTHTFTLTGGPAGMSVNSAGVITYEPTNADADASTSRPFPIVLRVTDSLGAWTEMRFAFTVLRDGQLPVVTVAVETPSPQIGEAVTIRVTASDNVGLKNVSPNPSLTVGGANVTLTPAITGGGWIGTYTPAAAGAFDIVATAVDRSDNVGTATSAVLVRRVANDQNAPVAAITSPVNGAVLMAETVVVTGTVSDADTNFWKYELFLVSHGDNGQRTKIGSGEISVTNGALGTIQAGSLRNGFYTLELVAYDLANKYAKAVANVEVAGQVKLGNFRVAETDLTVPVSGMIPLTLTRSYDTADAGRNDSDFGFGWRMGYDLGLEEAPEVRSEFPVDLSDPQQRTLGNISIRTDGNRDVYLTLPDGRRVRFKYVETALPGTNQLRAGFEADSPDVHASLRIDGPDILNWNSTLGFRYWAHIGLSHGDIIGNGGLAISETLLKAKYDFPGYVLTLEDGTSVQLAKTRVSGEVIYDFNGLPDLINSHVKATYDPDSLRVVGITDARGNRLDLRKDGFYSTNDRLRISFVRDNASGRVIGLKDAAGRRVVNYRYDMAGNLQFVERLRKIPAVGEAEQWDSTQYFYDPQHRLLKVTSPSGKTPVINEYDPATGRLIASIDPFGKRVEYAYDTGTRQQTVAGRREGVTPTVYAYDALGNVTSVTDPTGVRTDYTYEANSHRLASETTAAGTTRALTRTYGYDAKGFRTSESFTINGKTTSTTSTYVDTVRGEHVVESTVAADGTRTEQSYSPQDGTLTQSVVKDSAGVMREKTVFVHDVRGNLLSSTRWQRGTNGVWQAYAQSANIYANGRVVESREATAAGAGGVMLSKSTYAYDLNGNVTLTTQWLKNAATGIWSPYATSEQRYDAQGRMIATLSPLVTDPNDGVLRRATTSTTYDADGQVETTTDARGIVTRNTYDAMGRLSSTTHAYGRAADQTSESTTYDADGNVKTRTDAHGQVTQYRYDSANRLLQTLYPDGTSEETFYNVAGQAAWRTDRHAAGQAVVLGSKTTHDGANRATIIERRSGVVISVVMAGEVASATVSSQGTVLWTEAPVYDAAGRVEVSTDKHGQITNYQFDNMGRAWKTLAPPVTVWNPVGGVNGTGETVTMRPTTETTYDDLGRVKTVKDPTGRITTSVYDELGRVVRTDYPSTAAHGVTNTQATYDSLGRKVTETDQLGKVTSYEYDVLGNLTAVVQPAVDDAETVETTLVSPRYEYTYNHLGEQLTQTDAEGRTTSYDYDDFGRRTTRTLPGSAVETTAYDKFGRMTQKIDFKGQVEELVYDDDVRVPVAQRLNLGRLAEKRYYASITAAEDQSQRVSYTYDALGRTATLTDPRGTTTYIYDGEGRETQVASPEGTINYVYGTAAGTGKDRLVRTYTAHDDQSYTYDAMGRLASVTANVIRGVTLNEAGNYVYDLNGNLRSWSLTGRATSLHVYNYDELNRLTTLTRQNFTEPMTWNYATDKVGRRTTDGTKFRWEYDALGRLTREQYDANTNWTLDSANDYITTFAYDLVGNRKKKVTDKMGTTSDETVTYVYNSRDELTSETSTLSGATTYVYDANGSLTSKTKGTAVETYGYDKRNKMTSYTSSAGVTTTYKYDDEGLRVQRKVGTNPTTLYLLNHHNLTGYPVAFEERSGTSTSMPTVAYVVGHDVVRQSQDAAGTGTTDGHLHLVYDGQGNMRGNVGTINVGPTTIFATVGGTRDYSAFGELISGSLVSNLRHHGEYFDGITGFYFQGVRQRATFTWMQRDPYQGSGSEPLTLHSRIFVHNNPITLGDGSGMMPNQTDAIESEELIQHVRMLEVAHPFETRQELIERLYKETREGTLWKYIHTEEQSWIDLGHFFAAAHYRDTYGNIPTVLGGFFVEALQGAAGNTVHNDAPGAASSAFTFEDLGSNLEGVRLGTTAKMEEQRFPYDRRLSSLLEEHFARLRSTPPRQAPDWKILPLDEDQWEEWYRRYGGIPGQSHWWDYKVDIDEINKWPGERGTGTVRSGQMSPRTRTSWSASTGSQSSTLISQMSLPSASR